MTDVNWFALIAVTAGTSLGVCLLILLTQRWHGRLSLDHDTTGVQKLHRLPVPRVGGIGIALGLCLGAVLTRTFNNAAGNAMALLLLCAAPAFTAGLLEDLTKRVSVRMRLLATFASALAAVWLLDAQLFKLDTPGLDTLMEIAPLAMLFTCFAVSGVTNAINIVDGLNGLASGSVAIMLGGLGAMAWMQGDLLVLQLCLVGISAMLGFMVLNYPFGKIFLGDGGAYLAGFWLAECAVLLLVRNPQVSTWGVLLACLYPVWETLFSMFRRHIVHGVASDEPDMNHLHHLVLGLFTQGGLHDKPAWLRHGMSSCSIWMLVMLCQFMAVSGYIDSILMAMTTLAFCFAYSWAYINLSSASRHHHPVL